MADSTPFALSQLFTNLVDRHVAVADASYASANAVRKGYALYDIVGRDETIALTMDYELLGRLAGLLAYIPDAVVKQQLQTSPLEETLRDAMHEVLNITASVIVTEGRAVLKRMELDEAKGRAMVKASAPTTQVENRYSVTIAQGVPGQMTLVAPMF